MKQISKSELIIMDVLWKKFPMGAADVAESVTDQKWNIRTVKTLLSRLVQKGILNTQQDGRRYLYSPILSKDEYGVKILNGISESFYDGRNAALFLNLVKSNDLSSQDIDEISALLEKLKAEKGQSQ